MPDIVPKRTGRPPREFTAEQRQQAEVLSGVGLTHKQIATLLRCHHETLERHLGPELEYGSAKATAQVAQSLYQKAIGGDTASMIFWMKVRAGWRETNRIEMTGADGGAVQVEAVRDRIIGRISRLAAGEGEDEDPVTIEPE